MIKTMPAPYQPSPVLVMLHKAANTVLDFVLFVLVLGFTGIAMIAVAIVAPLAVGISAIVGRGRTDGGRPRSSWKQAKTGQA